MKKLIVGAWQGISKDGDVDANAARAAQAIDEAAAAGCAFLCLPETFLTGCGTVAEVRAAAIPLSDPRLVALARHAGKRKVVTLVGLTEKRGRRYAITQAILDGGKVAGSYVKTMPTGFDWEVMQYHDDQLPVFRAKGLTYGVIVCHDSSFPEVAATLVWKGARIIFSPHFNNLPRNRMNAHRILVRNNHVGLAAHYNVVVVRANVVGHWDRGDLFGYGDSAIFGPDGAPLAEAGLFTEKLITADVAPYIFGANPWRQRTEMRRAIVDQLHAASCKVLKK
jgi:5-aminopentanamidase